MTLDPPATAGQRKVSGTGAGSGPRLPPSLSAPRPARSAFDLWQAHARRSFEAACRNAPGESDTVHLFKARRTHAPREFARRLSLAVALNRANDPRSVRARRLSGLNPR
jgi:hypothetical protein